MLTPKIENLIIKYITRCASAKDIDVLVQWVKDANNLVVFKSYVKTHFAINYSMNDSNADKIKEELLSKIRNDKSIFSKLKTQVLFKYAAIAIIFISVGYFYQNYSVNHSNDVLISNEEFVTLELENGNVKILSDDGQSKVRDDSGNVVGKQKGSQLVYESESIHEGLSYNILKTPYGKRFSIQLSDGTTVQLNSGSTLKYPVNFLEGDKRQVYLTGEAYFDVAKDEKHPFVVNVAALNVEVLGTQFNVSTYPEDTTTDVVLVEGSVRMFQNDGSDDKLNSVILEPGYAGVFDKLKAKISTKPVVTSVYTSWVQGELVFRNITFSNILKKMERHYNIEITNNNVELAHEEFNASFGDEPIEKILNYLEITYNINVTIKENKIIIN